MKIEIKTKCRYKSPLITIDTTDLSNPYEIKDALELSLKLEGHDQSTIDDVFNQQQPEPKQSDRIEDNLFEEDNNELDLQFTPIRLFLHISPESPKYFGLVFQIIEETDGTYWIDQINNKNGGILQMKTCFPKEECLLLDIKDKDHADWLLYRTQVILQATQNL